MNFTIPDQKMHRSQSQASLGKFVPDLRLLGRIVRYDRHDPTPSLGREPPVFLTLSGLAISMDYKEPSLRAAGF